MLDTGGHLLVRGEDGNVISYPLLGKQGYQLMEELGLIRVWDDTNTWLVAIPELVSLKLKTEQRSER